ncbi:hypothetical protein AVEN_59992-1 [Araneus ventricosus]|uniref:Uncharacterized protein n=1 Tax=Araneus ventricosus TaxID=182803 RepID=A0A4Y2CBG1_ARAVE|nr:hypothetical protein AVEN_59992-1 [Araneus ventricosus]
MTVKLYYKKEEKSTSYSHLSQEPHPFCTKGCNSFRLSGGFRNQRKILGSIAARLCTEELPCSNSPRACTMAATFWRNICKLSESQRQWTGQRPQYSSYGQL